jgi:hypothetical protein
MMSTSRDTMQNRSITFMVRKTTGLGARRLQNSREGEQALYPGESF